jgi:hypothetical protein
MADFIIANTNFGIDVSRSSFGLTRGFDGRSLLTAEIHGDQEIYDKVSAGEASEWFWTLYPPYFYLFGYPVTETANDRESTIELKPEVLADLDVALYMMEHNDVEDVILKLGENRIELSGRVSLMGDIRDFRINWEK